jgi:hypothetical protein
MPYTINRYNGAVVTTVADGTIDTTTDLKMIGKNYAGYGEIQNENFLFLLENFSNANPPPKAIAGQMWYDSGTSKLKFYDGSKFRTTGGAEVGGTRPSGLTTGDFWFDTVNKQLYSWNGADFTLIGPQGVAGSQTTQMRSKSVRDTNSNTHAVIEAIVNGQTIFIISPDAVFTLDSATSAIEGFTTIQQGITLKNTNNPTFPGETQTAFRFWGTASNSDRLGGFGADQFVKADNAGFGQLVSFSDAGYTVGTVPKLRVFNASNTTPTIQNGFNDTIVFITKGSIRTESIPMKLIGPDIVPGYDNESDIGTSSLRYKTVHAVTFNGTATRASTLQLGTSFLNASVSSSPDTIVVRDGDSDVFANVFHGTATSANYADLAEKYLADAEYEIGTVLMVGGEKEVTAAQVGYRALGAVSEKPAYLMNDELEGGTVVALKGRIPVKVIGHVKKGQRLVAATNGTAQATVGNNADVFAIALESSDDVNVKLVECVIL